MKLAPSPAGAYLSSSQTTVTGSGAHQIILSTVDTGYPYTRLTSGIITLEMEGPVNISAQAVIDSFDTITALLYVNGVQVKSGNTAVTSTLTYSYVAKTGDQLALYETDDSGGGDSIHAGATTTFLHVLPLGSPNFTGLPITFHRANMR